MLCYSLQCLKQFKVTSFCQSCGSKIGSDMDCSAYQQRSVDEMIEYSGFHASESDCVRRAIVTEIFIVIGL